MGGRSTLNATPLFSGYYVRSCHFIAVSVVSNSRTRRLASKQLAHDHSMDYDISSDNSCIDTWRASLDATTRPQCVAGNNVLWLPNQIVFAEDETMK